jgi:hypothetical protein
MEVSKSSGIYLGDSIESRFLVERFERWMRLAFDEARTAMTIAEVPIGAVFVLHPVRTVGASGETAEVDFERGHVVATGYNRTVLTKNVWNLF